MQSLIKSQLLDQFNEVFGLALLYNSRIPMSLYRDFYEVGNSSFSLHVRFLAAIPNTTLECI